MNDMKNVTFAQIADWTIKLTYPILIGLIGWAGSQFWEYEVRLTKLEAKQYTAADAEKGFASITTELKAIQKDINDVNRKIDTQHPPKWLLDRLSFLEQEVNKIKENR